MVFGWSSSSMSNIMRRQISMRMSGRSHTSLSHASHRKMLPRNYHNNNRGPFFLPNDKFKATTMTTGALFLLAASSISSSSSVHNNNSSTMGASMCEPEEEEEEDELLEMIPEEWCTFDSYNGVIIQLPNNNNDTDTVNLEKRLQQSIKKWKKDGKRGIWIHANPQQHVRLFPFLVKELGFEFHQCSPNKDYIVMTKWLPTEEENRLPFGPTHQVGVGIIVFRPSTDGSSSSNKQILVVQEKSGPASLVKLWKMPTGLVDPGEDISDAALRELQEETGISCDFQFQKIVGFRQAHSSSRPSDLFFLCTIQLQPPTTNDDNDDNDLISFQPQASEIADIQWMDIHDFMNQSFWKDSPIQQQMHQVLHDLTNHNDDNDNDNIGFVSKKLPVGYRPGFHALYVHDNKSKL
eukprot:CAMPEP_0197826636 /NCGR_PEP_ID=MMETSP1437-20131217/3572_1 /TAXON_ID=49252 ORGANISM="Eucampia antarctica, Strain CCMP1452" /NCGR_SAMPLE_ID=MMETSP1437 /ASSEMBLY_ACC=CAM_ASM_001096 /LENGTH=406 /DNA_ID=CAMNT_0043427157 /DNA_START=80 /DNA_END=1300 /DNA_ORIENTATION=+